MPDELSLPLQTLYSFLIVLSRIAGAVVFTPIPGVTSMAEPARVVLSLALTISLAPLWPTVTVTPGIFLLVGWLLSEAAFGVTIGLVVSFLSEAFAVFGQIVALQAGYSF